MMAKGVPSLPPRVTPAERATWALDRLFDAIGALERFPADASRSLAVVGRYQEYRAAERIAKRAAHGAAISAGWRRKKSRACSDPNAEPR
jgi:hypothetical protein